MAIFLYLIRLLNRYKWWLILLPILAVVLSIRLTRNLSKTYAVSTTIYTGVASGFNIQTDASAKLDVNAINNSMDNMVNIIQSETTLKEVSLRLFAEQMCLGDPHKDTPYILAENYRAVYSHIPADVKALIKKDSVKQTYNALKAYQKEELNNYVYGLFVYEHPYYSKGALQKIKVRRVLDSDMIQMDFSGGDPGTVYRTLTILAEVFIDQYQELRFSQTNSVIEYFESELARIGHSLRIREDSLVDYNMENRVINYYEQTRQIASEDRDFKLEYTDAEATYKSAKVSVEQLEKQLDKNLTALKSNSFFIEKLHSVAEATSKLTLLESTESDSLFDNQVKLNKLRKQVQNDEDEIQDFIRTNSTMRFTKEGLSTMEVVNQWFSDMIALTKADAKMKVLQIRRDQLEDEYNHYSPIGAIIKRKEREINFDENTYLNNLRSLNEARTRQKSLEMTSAILKVMNPPAYPITSLPSPRKKMVMGAGIGTFIFVLLYFLIIDLLDKTLRNSMRARSMIGGNVLAVFPYCSKKGDKVKDVNLLIEQKAVVFLFGAIAGKFSSNPTKVIHVVSLESGEGKSYISSRLINYMAKLHIDAEHLNWRESFEPYSKEYLLSSNVTDFSRNGNKDVFLLEHPPMNDYSLPSALMQTGEICLMIVRSDRAWKDVDKILYNRLIAQSRNIPVFICLNLVDKEELEIYTGMLPPYSKLRNLGYRLSHFGLTARK